VPTSKGKGGREGGRGAGDGVRKGGEGKEGEYRHFFLCTLSIGYNDVTLMQNYTAKAVYW